MENKISEAVEFEILNRLTHIRAERDLFRQQLIDALQKKDEIDHDLRRVVAELERERIYRDKQESYLETYCAEDYAASMELQKTREKLNETQRLLAITRNESVKAWSENATLQLELDNVHAILRELREQFSPETLERLVIDRVSAIESTYNQKLNQAYSHIERETRKADILQAELNADRRHVRGLPNFEGDPLSQAIIKLRHLDAQIAQLDHN